jgi:hypothetical protein
LKYTIIRTAGLTAASGGVGANCVGVAASVFGSTPDGFCDRAGRPRNRIIATMLIGFDMLT